MPFVSLYYLLLVALSSLLKAHAQAAPSIFARETAVEAEELIPEFSRNALTDPAYLPAQIGGIVGAYAVSLVLVAVTLLSLSKRRREALNAGDEETDFDYPEFFLQQQLEQYAPEESSLSLDTNVAPTFSYPSATNPHITISCVDAPGLFARHSPVSSIVSAPGINPLVDQSVVQADKAMAQNQLEDMYKHVLEHDEAKRRGEVLEQPVYPAPTHEKPVEATPKKMKSKPASLNLSETGDAEKKQSRTASILSALRSPGFGSRRKKAPKGLDISSPMMTPQTATFPRPLDPQALAQTMANIETRTYSSQPPPPIPTDQTPLPLMRSSSPPTNYSPESTQSIDERLGVQLGHLAPGKAASYFASSVEGDPESATSTHSRAPLVGLPQSPKPGVTFPALPGSPRPGSTFTLPASPKPGSTFQRANAPSAVRAGGALPLRAYEPSLNSPSIISTTTKQTTFERKAPSFPMGAQTPGVPYSPYQPFTPCVPMTPSLVTREDRKRMRKLMPKTPTVEMVKSSDEIW